MAELSLNEMLENLVKDILCPSDIEISKGKERFDQIERILHQSRVRNTIVFSYHFLFLTNKTFTNLF